MDSFIELQKDFFVQESCFSPLNPCIHLKLIFIHNDVVLRTKLYDPLCVLLCCLLSSPVRQAVSLRRWSLLCLSFWWRRSSRTKRTPTCPASASFSTNTRSWWCSPRQSQSWWGSSDQTVVAPRELYCWRVQTSTVRVWTGSNITNRS